MVVFCLLFCFLIFQADTINPEALEWFRKGEELIGTDREHSEEQAEFFEKALEIDPEFAPARYNLILVYWHQNKFQRALTHCNELIRLKPEDVRTYRLRSRIFRQLERPEEARLDLERAADLAPDNYEILEDLAQHYYESQEYLKAIQIFERALKVNPSPVEIYFNLGLAQQSTGQLEEAVVSYQKFLAVYPDDYDARFLLGMAYRDLGKVESAIEELLKAEQLRPNDPELNQQLGDLLLSSNRVEEARQRLNRKELETARNLSNLGIIAKREGKPEEALNYLQRAVALEPSSALIWGHLGDVFNDLRRIQESMDAYRKAIELDPRDFSSTLNLGSLLANQEELEEAEKLLQKAVTLNPESADAYYALGNVSDRLGKDRQALSQYLLSLEKGLDNPLVYFRVAVLYAKQSKIQESIRYLTEAFKRDPERFVPIVVEELKAVRSDLDNIRYRPEFTSLLEKYREHW